MHHLFSTPFHLIFWDKGRQRPSRGPLTDNGLLIIRENVALRAQILAQTQQFRNVNPSPALLPEPLHIEFDDVTTTTLNHHEFVLYCYRTLLSRPPDIKGLASNLQFLEAGGQRLQIVSGMLESVEYRQSRRTVTFKSDRDMQN
jgi:hypothetical protein